MRAGSSGGWKSSLSIPGLGAQPSGAPSLRSDENPPHARSHLRSSVHWRLSMEPWLDPKLFDTGRGRGKLIAMFLRFFAGKARVSSNRGLLFGVSRQLLLSRRSRAGIGVEIGSIRQT